ncbi:penicillin-binding transpeptidase domain-containing protein [Patescibacteria group bacterium]
MRFFRKKIRKKGSEDLDFEEVLFDTRDDLEMERESMEGVMEKPFSKYSFYILGLVLLIFGILLFMRIFWLTVIQGDELFIRSESNRIDKEIIQPVRGLIYDRMGHPLVENIWIEEGEVLKREARDPMAYSHLLGYIGEPSRKDIEIDSDITKFQMIGKDGIEYFYDNFLRGDVGYELWEVDADGEIISQGILKDPEEGRGVFLSINSDLQEEAFRLLSSTAEDKNFQGGSLLVFDIQNGEILSFLNYPSFDINLMSGDTPQEVLDELRTDERSPFLNRAIAGFYPPGSSIKPFLALAALEEHNIDPDKEILSTGSIRIPDPYYPDKYSIFADWKAHGWVDMRRAIAVSSNVYFYAIGGGYEDVRGLGIRKIKEWLTVFGFGALTGIDLPGEKAGIVPDPEWKEYLHPDNPLWRIGDTYNVSIGQGDLTITPVEMMSALSALVNREIRPTPHILLGLSKKDDKFIENQAFESEALQFDKPSLKVVYEGMRDAVLDGTASYLSGINIPIAAKTGTAQAMRGRTHSWLISFAPYDNPRLGMIVFLESGPEFNLVGSTFVAGELFRWIESYGGIDVLLAKQLNEL